MKDIEQAPGTVVEFSDVMGIMWQALGTCFGCF